MKMHYHVRKNILYQNYYTDSYNNILSCSITFHPDFVKNKRRFKKSLRKCFKNFGNDIPFNINIFCSNVDRISFGIISRDIKHNCYKLNNEYIFSEYTFYKSRYILKKMFNNDVNIFLKSKIIKNIKIRRQNIQV